METTEVRRVGIQEKRSNFFLDCNRRSKKKAYTFFIENSDKHLFHSSFSFFVGLYSKRRAVTQTYIENQKRKIHNTYTRTFSCFDTLRLHLNTGIVTVMSDEHHNNMGPVMVCLHRIKTVKLFKIIFIFAGCNTRNSGTKVNYFSIQAKDTYFHFPFYFPMHIKKV